MLPVDGMKKCHFIALMGVFPAGVLTGIPTPVLNGELLHDQRTLQVLFPHNENRRVDFQTKIPRELRRASNST